MSMSLAELRKELREARKTETKPVSRMKKHEVALELERRKGGSKKAVEPESSSDEEAVVEKVEKVLKKAKVPEAVVEKAVKKVEKVVEPRSEKKVEKKKPVKASK